MNPVQPSLRAALRAGSTMLAVEITSGSAAATELVCGAGVDTVVLDARHAAVSPYSDDLERIVRAADTVGTPAIVRVGDNTPGTINRAMNDGASGILVAVDRPASAAAAVAATRYPPHGHRGAAPVVRAARYGLTPWDDYRRATNDDRPVLVSIEHVEVLGDVGAIAEVPGVDVVVFDVFPLLVAAGEDGDPAVVPAMLAAPMREVLERGVTLGAVAAEPDSAPALLAAGCSFVVLGSDVAAYARAARALRRSLDAVPRQLAGAPDTVGATP